VVGATPALNTPEFVVLPSTRVRQGEKARVRQILKDKCTFYERTAGVFGATRVPRFEHDASRTQSPESSTLHRVKAPFNSAAIDSNAS